VQVTNLATIELVGTDNQAAVGRWDFTASAVPDAVVDPRANLPALSPEEAQRQLVTSVRELDEADESRSLIIHRLRDLLLIDDQLPAVLIETLRTDELSEQTRADLYLAFELAGTPASQAALASVLLDNNWPPMDAMRAIVALAGVGEPTEDTLATLWGLARTDLAATDRRDLPGTAALAIGSLGNGMRTSGESDYTTLRDDLLVSASGAIEPEQRAVFLYALGNTADPDPLLKRDLVSYLDDPSTEVRSAAAKTLARLGADQVAEELLLRVQQESSDQARASMAEALASWDEPTAQAMQWAQAAVQQEADDRARYNIAVLLGNNMETFPENRRVLEMLLESEQSKRIRQKVANMLY
jgi:HEAT repeat protein